MHTLKLAIPALLLVSFLALNAYCDGDAFKEEDSLIKQKNSSSAASPSSRSENLSEAGASSPQVVEMPFFSKEEIEVPPLETEVYPEDESVHLTMTPEEAHDRYLIDSRPAWYKRIPWGLGRGFVNLVTCPGELGRGFTYSFGEYHWALAAPVGLVAGIAGTLGRCGAGCADILTMGLLGDRDLAENFPDYVWQGQWDYGLYGNKQVKQTAEEEENVYEEELGKGYIPSPTEKTPLKARRALKKEQAK